MTPRELVQRAVTFRSPERTPRQVWVLPWAEGYHPDALARLRAEFPDDIVAAPGLYRKPLPVEGARYEKGSYVDEWGCRFENIHGGVIGIVRDPVIREPRDYDAFCPPSCTLDLDTEAINRFCAGTDRFVLAANLVRPFERLCFLRTMEHALVDVLTRPPEFLRFLERMHAHYCAEVEAWAATDVDAIVIMDDWGGQDRMLVSPAAWRRLFKPLYRDYCERARRAGKLVFMHSDGYILDILPDLIEVGVQALNSQVACMGVEKLARFRGQIAFWGEIDRQQVLPFGSRDDVRRTVREVWNGLRCRGGVIAQCEFGPGVEPDNVIEVFRCWQDLDREA